jgi:hypothetical protein
MKDEFTLENCTCLKQQQLHGAKSHCEAFVDAAAI